MIKIKVFIIFFFVSNIIYSQTYRIFGGIDVSYSYGSFWNGNKLSTGDPNITFDGFNGFATEPRMSLDWPDPPQYSFLQNFGRRYHYLIGVERSLKKNFAMSIGFELGARTFAIKELDENGAGYLLGIRSYKTYSLPINVSHYNKIYGSFYLRKSLGFSFNIPESYSESDPFKTYIVKAYSPLYILASVGLDIEYRFENGSGISLGTSYNQGFTNVINDQMNYDIKYIDTQKTGWGSSNIYSNGSHWLFGVKYFFPPFDVSTKQSKMKIKEAKINALNTNTFKRRIIGIPINFKVDTTQIKVCVWDDQRIDGDSVSIEYKDSIIMGNIGLDRNMKCINIEVKRDQPNYFIVHALNEGRVKPNTVQVVIYDKSGKKKVHIRSDMQKSGAINLVVE